MNDATILIGAIVLGLALGYRFARWLGVARFALAAAVLFALVPAVNVGGGNEGLPSADSLAFFKDDLVSYLGYNAQITDRVFAVPALALGMGGVLARG